WLTVGMILVCQQYLVYVAVVSHLRQSVNSVSVSV
ncbi:glutamine--tRNA ligase, partial [Vibrio parahaemolyticus V-223/04]